MADRKKEKKERKRARKPAASKPKAAAPVIANIAATGRAVSMGSAQASAIIAGAGGGHFDAEVRNRVTTPADNVARVFEQISTTLAALRSRQGLDGDNQASERDKAIDDFEVYIRLGNTTIRVVHEQTRSQAPSKAVVEQNAAACHGGHDRYVAAEHTACVVPGRAPEPDGLAGGDRARAP